MPSRRNAALPKRWRRTPQSGAAPVTCHSCDVLIHNGNLGGVYTLFDVSGTVGEANRVVRVRCAPADGGWVRHAGKPGPGAGVDPFPGDWDSQYDFKALNTSYCDTGLVCVIEVPTDELGQIRLKGWGTTEYRLVEWREVTFDSYSSLFSGVPPGSWTDLTVNASGLMYCSVRYTGYGSYAPWYTTRTDGETAEAWPGAGSGGTSGGVHSGLILRPEAGVIEHLGDVSSSQELLLAAHWALTDSRSHPSKQIFSGNAPTGGMVNCDASAVVGARRANLWLAVRTTSGPGAYVGLRFKPSDDAGDYYQGRTYFGVYLMAVGANAAFVYCDGYALGRVGYQWVETGPGGVFQWDASTNNPMTIDVEGYELVD